MGQFMKRPTVLAAMGAQVVSILALFLPWISKEGVKVNFLQMMQGNAGNSDGLIMLALVLLGILGTVVCFLATHPKISLIPTVVTLGIAALLTFAGGANGYGIYLFMGAQLVSAVCGLATGKSEPSDQEKAE